MAWVGIRLACGCVRSASPDESRKESTACVGRFKDDKHKRLQPIVERIAACVHPHRCDQPLPVVEEPIAVSPAMEALAPTPAPVVETQTEAEQTPMLLPVAGQLTFGALLGA